MSLTFKVACSDDVLAESKAPHTDKKKGRKSRRRTNDNRPLLTIKSILPVKEDLTVTCDLDTGKATATFDFDCNHDTADDIIRNLVSSATFWLCFITQLFDVVTWY